MAPPVTSRDAEHEIATIRCLLAQQIHILDRHADEAAEHRSANHLMRLLLRRDEDLRARLAEGAVPEADGRRSHPRDAL